MQSKQILAAVVGIATFAVAAPASAAIVANFTDGNGAGVDGYAGSGGNGWEAGWLNSTNNGSVSATITNANPINGGGNYLAVTASAANPTGGTGNPTNGRGFINRGFDSVPGDVNAAATHVVQFTLRVDESLANFNSGSNDRFLVAGSTGAMNDFDSVSSWAVAAYGGDPDSTGPLTADTWLVYNGTKNGTFATGSFVNAGIALVQNGVYTFTFTVDPVDKSYKVSISNGTTTYNTPVNTSFGFRSNSSDTDTLNFGSKLSGSNETFQFSLDGVSVSVPEPSALAACLLAAPLMRRRRA